MEHVHVTEEPALERPLLVAAFGGWNDAASAATWAVKFLVNQWDARPFAEIDPEPFFDFSSTRPQVRISSGAVRRVSWPANRFYACHAGTHAMGSLQRDVILLLGEEPQLRWRTFTAEILSLARRYSVQEFVLLGSLVAEVPHTAPVQISGTSNRSATLRQMGLHGIERASYTGATGVLTVLQDAARKEGWPATGLWGVAPHYVSATPNLPVSEALLRKLDVLCALQLQLGDLARAAHRFTQRVSSLVAEDPDVSAYVHELERRGTATDAEAEDRLLLADASGVHRIPVEGELPSGEQAVRSVEELLKRYRDETGTE